MLSMCVVLMKLCDFVNVICYEIQKYNNCGVVVLCYYISSTDD